MALIQLRLHSPLSSFFAFQFLRKTPELLFQARQTFPLGLGAQLAGPNTSVGKNAQLGTVGEGRRGKRGFGRFGRSWPSFFPRRDVSPWNLLITGTS